eukprot:Phypoly_transcript_10515.p1 GENE.Phypoly_transcript_10515~~Phypoly_transcript_10515.p1  ORF type:complete len:314 (+),score=-5.53 Phypoly_transcript_10515:26-943(+)
MSTYTLFTNVLGPLSLASTIICGLATVTSYIYPQQRKFPNVVLVWTCLNDFFTSLITTMNWIPGPVKNNLTLNVVDPDLCTFIVYTDWAMELSASMLNLLLSYTLYATIVKQIDLHAMRKVYYYRYLAIFWVPTMGIPLICLFEFTHAIGDGYCSPRTKVVTSIKLVTWLLPFCVQVVLMTVVFKEVYTVTRAVRNNLGRSSNTGFLWLCARSLGAQCNQVAIWLPSTIWQFYFIFGKPAPNALNYIIAISFGFPALNGCIVLAGNTPLWDSIFSAYTGLHSWCAKLTPKSQRIAISSSELSEFT